MELDKRLGDASFVLLWIINYVLYDGKSASLFFIMKMTIWPSSGVNIIKFMMKFEQLWRFIFMKYLGFFLYIILFSPEWFHIAPSPYIPIITEVFVYFVWWTLTLMRTEGLFPCSWNHNSLVMGTHSNRFLVWLRQGTMVTICNITSWSFFRYIPWTVGPLSVSQPDVHIAEQSRGYLFAMITFGHTQTRRAAKFLIIYFRWPRGWMDGNGPIVHVYEDNDDGWWISINFSLYGDDFFPFTRSKMGK